MSEDQEGKRRGRPPLSKELIIIKEQLRKRSHDSGIGNLSGRAKPEP